MALAAIQPLGAVAVRFLDPVAVVSRGTTASARGEGDDGVGAMGDVCG